MWPFGTPSNAEAARQLKVTTRESALRWAEHHVPEASPSDDLPILSASLEQLQAGLRDKKWTVVQILQGLSLISTLEPEMSDPLPGQTFIRAAVKSHKKCNNLTEIMFETAMIRAEIMDRDLQYKGPSVLSNKPLYGVPVSIKDQLDVEGYDSCMGYSAKVDRPATHNAIIVQVLLHAGAIPFVKTNVPQTLLSFECGNPVWGATCNPFSSVHTSGGSSGGEAALLASDGAAVGIGSDIGGSCRIPAGFSGCYGLKTCYPRLAKEGGGAANPGFEAIKSTLGPMARSIEDLEYLFRTIVDTSTKLNFHQTHEVVPLPYQMPNLPKKLRIGYWKSDKFVKACPASQRAVQESADAMHAAGHEVIEIKPPAITEALCIFVALTGGDGYERLLASLEGDPAEPHLFLIRLQAAMGPYLTHFLSWLSSAKDPVMHSIISATGVKPVSEVLEWQHRKALFSGAVRKHFFRDLALDAIICPIQATSAIKLKTSWNLAFLAAPTVFFNVVDSAVTAVPVTRVQKDDILTEEWKAQPSGSFLLEQALYSPEHGQYDPTGESLGLPVGVQVACSLYEEEKSLAISRLLVEALGRPSFSPGSFTQDAANAGQNLD